MRLNKYSLGIGDRFAHQAKAQLTAIMKAQDLGLEITPVWNKSYREHRIIESNPAETRREADRATRELGYTRPYFVDADHITMNTVDFFLDHCDFFTLDVADFIGQKASGALMDRFINDHSHDLGPLDIPGIDPAPTVTREFLAGFASTYLMAIESAKKIYRYLSRRKGAGNFITEVSMDEVNSPQSLLEFYFILEQLSGIPVQTIAPKFTGQFNKGVDYTGDLDQFEKDLDQMLVIISHAKRHLRYPEDLKISIHSGSDKFSLYPVIRELCQKHDQGLHLKTAGTTWLEEVIGLSLSGREGLALVREIYAAAYKNIERLCAPYKNVVQIDRKRLPRPGDVNAWDGTRFADTLRHDQEHAHYNAHFRQLLHVGYKIAAGLGKRYLEALKKYHNVIGEQVTVNLLERHIKPLFF